MLDFYKSICIFFFIAALGTFIAWGISWLTTGHNSISLIAMGGCLTLLGIYPLIQGIYFSKIQTLRNKILYKLNVQYQSALSEEQELERLENMSIKRVWVASWFKTKTK